MKFFKFFYPLLLLSACVPSNNLSVVSEEMTLTRTEVFPVGLGWASNSVNTTIFRKNSVVSDKIWQYTAFYDAEGYVVLAKRHLGDSVWRLQKTPYTGNVKDAHNSISIMLDGAGYLHVSWDHHGTPLKYARSIAPDTLVLGPQESMTGIAEEVVSYPEFYRLPKGDLLFFYRNGASGNGNMVINRYDVATASWTQVQSNLLDGENQRNAYWQACIDAKGTVHLSWVWRETWDVSSNHDMNYARSLDGGKTWEKSNGDPYSLPINIATAEVIDSIPQKSELINQTAISVDEKGRPGVATYFHSDETNQPEFHVIYQTEDGWKVSRVSSRNSSFSLSGGGTKRIPISRPQLLFRTMGEQSFAALLFRDEERENRPSIYYNLNFPEGKWEVGDLAELSLGSWEPSYDTERWMREGVLSLFVQQVEQIDGEGLSVQPPQMVKILDWRP